MRATWNFGVLPPTTLGQGLFDAWFSRDLKALSFHQKVYGSYRFPYSLVEVELKSTKLYVLVESCIYPFECSEHTHIYR